MSFVLHNSTCHFDWIVQNGFVGSELVPVKEMAKESRQTGLSREINDTKQLRTFAGVARLCSSEGSDEAKVIGESAGVPEPGTGAAVERGVLFSWLEASKVGVEGAVGTAEVIAVEGTVEGTEQEGDWLKKNFPGA
jgi:hypothetical protein